MYKLTNQAGIILSFIALSLTSSQVIAQPDFGPVDMANFYVSLPAVDPAAPLGTLVKSEKIDTTIAGVAAWKIAYVSSDVADRKTLVTAIVAAPTGVVPAGGRPIMAWAHGTTGTAETCGPSQVLNPAQPLNQYFLPTGNSWTDFGIPALDTFIKAGYVIVATDYQGLGGGGKHQYTVAATQGRDVINSIRAVTQIKEAGAGSKAVVYGWSQGGGAVLAAASLIDYLNTKGSAHDGMQIVGAVAMAPFDIAVTFPNKHLNDAEAVQYMQKLSDQFGSNVFNFTHYAQNSWGMVAAFPQLKMQDIFTAEGASILNDIFSRKCMHVASDTLNYAYSDQYKKLMRPDIKNAKTWIDAYLKGSILPVKPTIPVIIYYGNNDTTLPPIMGKLYQDQMCKMGANITRIQLPGNQTHFSTPASAEPFYVKWVADRFAGVPAANGCHF